MRAQDRRHRLLHLSCVFIAAFSFRNASSQEAAPVLPLKPSQSLSLNLSDLPVASFLFKLSDAAYHPGNFKETTDAIVLGAKDSGRFDGFQALAVEYTVGERKFAVIAFAGTDVLSADILADQRLGLELFANARFANKDIASAYIEQLTADSHNFLDSHLTQSIAFVRDIQKKTGAPIILTGHSLGGAAANLVSGKLSLPSVTFASPPIPNTVLDRFGVEHAGVPSSIHFFRTSDLVPLSWPNTPDAVGRRIPLAALPPVSAISHPAVSLPGFLVAQHSLVGMADIVTLHPSYAQFVKGAAATMKENLKIREVRDSNEPRSAAKSNPSTDGKRASETGARTIVDLLSSKEMVASAREAKAEAATKENTSDGSAKEDDSEKTNSNKTNSVGGDQIQSRSDNETEGITFTRPKGSKKITEQREGGGDEVTYSRKTTKNETKENSTEGGAESTTSSKDSSTDESDDNDTTERSGSKGGGSYTQEQWLEKHTALVSEHWQRAFEDFLRENPPNVDPSQDADNKYLAQLENQLWADLKERLPKPNEDPYPPGITEIAQPALEAELKGRVPLPNVDPPPPGALPVKDEPPPAPLPAPALNSRVANAPNAGIEHRGQPHSNITPMGRTPSSIRPRAELLQKGPYQNWKLNGVALYCTSKLDGLHKKALLPAHINVLLHEFNYHRDNSILAASTSTFESMISDAIRKLKGVQLATNTFENAPARLSKLETMMRNRGKRITIYEGWGAGDFSGDADGTISKYSDDDSIFVALNTFSVDSNTISLLPDYEALGELAARTLNDLAPTKVVLLTSDRMKIASVRTFVSSIAKHLSAKLEDTQLEFDQLAGTGSPFKDKVAVLYFRRSGKDRNGDVVSDENEAKATEVLLSSTGKRFIFVSIHQLGSGFTLRAADTSITTRTGGTDIGVGYWAKPVQAVLEQLLPGFEKQSGVDIKDLNMQNHPLSMELIFNSNTRRRSPSEMNICLY